MSNDKKEKDLTTIQIKKVTLGRLKAFKLVNKESYDELLNRLMNKITGNPRG